MIKTIQTDVLKRFMSDASLKEFFEQYRNNLYRHRTVKTPSEKDVKVANLFKQYRSYSEVAKKIGIPAYQVRASIGRVYAHKK